MGLKKTFFLFLSSFVLIDAQENLAFSNDQFSGINSAILTPTQPFLNPNPWDINLFSADVFLQNDYAYISNQSFLGLRNEEIISRDLKNGITGENTAGVLDFYNDDFGSYHISSDVLGPSFSLKSKIRKKVFQLGIFTRFRTQTFALKVDNYLKFGNQSLSEPNNYTLQPLKINLMNWGEIGMNIATEIFENSSQKWIVGANFKYEMGYDAFMVNSKDAFQINRTNEEVAGVPTKTIDASGFNIETSFATNYNFETEKYEFKKIGQGFGLDVGLSMIDKEEDSDDYNLKAGFSILDIGQVNFQGQRHLLQGNNLRVVNNPNLDNTKFASPQQYLELLSTEVYGDSKASFQGNDFSTGLPTSVHFNLSKNIRPNHYVNFDWIQRAPVFRNSLKRSNITNVSYTVQRPVIGYGASASLYEYQKLQFGGYFKIGPLILGSSNVLPLLFKQKKLHSGDFFIALKIYPFWDNEMKRHRRANCNCD
ncbi:hypothetical protein [Chryseobacterium sp. MP_3.2]|uniref:hypothetical protein n=1 Tax=Chryseobacterium sp. MP_3.2 TaxID=3071712 RepID=UPI002E08386D|nr:hypothetical protein [Chryseobacterium sp. MP_3.2]